MATLLITAAGSALGSAVLPSGLSLLGTGITGAALGKAAGGALGSVLDQRLFGPGSQLREGPRLSSLDVVASTEGAPVARVFGKIRVAGQVIWATRFTETAMTETQSGGKGAGGASVSTTTYSYSCSFAIGLCEGPIAGVSRLWADGKPLSLDGVEWRLHTGDESQTPDPLIALKNPDAPAYRGLAYIVFEDLPLAPFGNRVPQITVEVRRDPDAPQQHQDGPNLPALIEGVAMSPGSGEFTLATQPVRRLIAEGTYQTENINNVFGQPDFLRSLDQLEETCPNCKSVLLVVSWFGDDLRLGQCRLTPGVDQVDKQTEPLIWQVSGHHRDSARALSRDEAGRAYYGGTPSDVSVFQSIQELKRRGFEVIFYPFILMDIPPDNALGQAVFPWRGRIASEVDGTAQAQSDVQAFVGSASLSQFGEWDGTTILYSGDNSASLRRMLLHYAKLCQAAGGVDAFIIGSELRGVTQTRDHLGDYPAVSALRAIAADVKAILPEAQLSYAADWSEYANHRPDGSDDVIFHLDPLWADPNIDFIGIDNYLPLSDWRQTGTHLDLAQAESIYDLDYLTDGIESGEYADWYYADEAARSSQARTPITDTAHGEDWVFGIKRLRDWWSSPHYNRPGGVRASQPTGWVPQSKPIRFTELGCAAVDLGTNQPNVFYDPKSTESALPYFSRGIRDDVIQRRYLQASLSHWQNDLMIAGSHVWTWDARPYPDFPLRNSIWSDGPNYELGHWINGRLDAAPLAEIVAELCAAAGETRIDVSRLHGLVDGYTIDRTMSARDALAPLMLVFGFDAIESDGLIRFVPRGDSPAVALSEDQLAVEGNSEPFTLSRAQLTDLPREVRLGYIRSDAEYQRGSVSASLPAPMSERVEETEHAIAMTTGKARAAARRWLAESHIAQDSLSLSLPPSLLALEAGDVIALETNARSQSFRLGRASGLAAREFEAVAVEGDLYIPSPEKAEAQEPPAISYPSPVLVEFLDLPPLRDATGSGIYAAAFASPWLGGVTLWQSPDGESYSPAVTLQKPATIGRTLTPLMLSDPWRWSQTSVDIVLLGGALIGASPSDTLAGKNAAALKTASEQWEIIQFKSAELIAEKTYRLSGLLRGQSGTEFLIDTIPANTRFVLLNEALKPLALGVDDLGRDFHWRFGPSSYSHGDETYQTLERSFEGVIRRPFTPQHLRASFGADGDLAASWVRRARQDADHWRHDPPLAEESERYLVTLFDADGAEITSTEADTSSIVFEASAFSGTPLAKITVSQISSVFGPGPAASLSLSSNQESS